MIEKLFFRERYINKILNFKDKNVIKVITGQRRVGKSYILLQLIERIKQFSKTANIIFIDKEDIRFDSIKNYTDLADFIKPQLNKTRKNYIFIDEIQDIAQFEKALRHFYSAKNIDIYCTGSNANLLSGELATFLSGRYIEFKIYSLSYVEFIEFHKIKNNNTSLTKYMNYGGLPFLINLPDSEPVISDYLKNIYATIMYKDIVSRYNIRNTHFLENLGKYLAQNTGNITSAKKISDYLKSQKQSVSHQVALNYLSYLQNSFLIYKVSRNDLLGKRIFELNEKYYFEDWGIKNAIIGFKQQLINQTIENVVFIHLKICGYEVSIGKINDYEIDFVAEKNGETIYIQAAYVISDEDVKEREFGNLLKIKDNWRKMVVSTDEFTLKHHKGIEHLKLIDFLTNFS